MTATRACICSILLFSSENKAAAGIDSILMVDFLGPLGFYHADLRHLKSERTCAH
jgi:hypothetical protein